MSFLEVRFPECISLGAIGGPGFRTDIVRVNSGHEYRNQGIEKALGKWTVAHNALNEEDSEALRAFFLIAAGAFNGFRFKDASDYIVEQSEGVLQLVTGSTYQFYKKYAFGGVEYLRKIQKPVNGTVTIYGATGGTISYTAGTITGATGTPTAWAGEFDVPCRFGTDEMELETLTKTRNGGFLYGWKSIPIMEIRV
jgi:uncharacterized protein (TIGR02217 family)